MRTVVVVVRAGVVALIGGSKWPGFKGSREMVSAVPLTSTVKSLSPCLSTLYGPSYAGCSGFCVALCLMYTCVHDERSSVTYVFLRACLQTGVALSLTITALRWVTYSAGSGEQKEESVSKN